MREPAAKPKTCAVHSCANTRHRGRRVCTRHRGRPEDTAAGSVDQLGWGIGILGGGDSTGKPDIAGPVQPDPSLRGTKAGRLAPGSRFSGEV